MLLSIKGGDVYIYLSTFYQLKIGDKIKMADIKNNSLLINKVV